MALYVQTNVQSLGTMRTLNINNGTLDSSQAKLSSGKEINTAKDNPANLQISNRFTSQISCKSQAYHNTSDGIALAQTIEGALDETTSLLQRIRTIAVQSSTGTNTEQDRASMQQEVTQLCNEITKIACTTKFGGEQLLRGANNGLIDAQGFLTLQVGANEGDRIRIDLSTSYRLEDLHQVAGGNMNNGYNTTDNVFDVTTQENAQDVLANIDGFILAVDNARSELGASMNRLESTQRNQSVQVEQESDARARIRDTDFAKETCSYVSAQIATKAASQVLMQANATPNFVLSLLH